MADRSATSARIDGPSLAQPPAPVLGIAVPPQQWVRWRGWFAPPVQPFRTERLGPLPAGAGPFGRLGPPRMEHRDTFGLYGHGTWVWLTEREYRALPYRIRRRLHPWHPAAPSDPVPSSGPAHSTGADQALRRFVERHWPASRHAEVTADVRRRTSADTRLPGLERVAGTFPAGSGPNCFGTVMAAAGEAGAESAWMQTAPFLDWLTRAATPLPRRAGTASDGEPGTVLLWRDRDREPVHAAVTIGGGWALNKPSQAWFTPRFVLTVTQVLTLSRHPGHRLERHLLR